MEDYSKVKCYKCKRRNTKKVNGGKAVQEWICLDCNVIWKIYPGKDQK